MKIGINGMVKLSRPAALECLILVTDFFKDWEKSKAWFKHENPLLGNMRPVDMIKQGRSEKLLKFIKTSLEENKRD
jgi:uncharacterized protein (DUF2384 family)